MQIKYRSSRHFYKELYILNIMHIESFENMKYSTLQEQEYGVLSPQSGISNEMDEIIIIDADNVESKNDSPLEEGSVVSNLPLLFANGYPTSLERFTLVQNFYSYTWIEFINLINTKA